MVQGAEYSIQSKTDTQGDVQYIVFRSNGATYEYMDSFKSLDAAEARVRKLASYKPVRLYYDEEGSRIDG